MERPSIRSGTVEDAPQISEFVRGLSEEFIVGEFSVEARARFLEDHSEQKVKERLMGDFRFYVAEHRKSIAGVAAIRSNSHLFYLFVGKAHQRTGLSKATVGAAGVRFISSGKSRKIYGQCIEPCSARL